jgi:peptidoglycan hydrolase CwlO-like protein
MRKLILFCAVCTLFFASCVKNSSEYKNLQAQNDSLMRANANATAEIDDIMSLMNEVEENFRSITSAENYLSVQSTTPGELSTSVRDRIHNEMQLVTNTLSKNKEQIANLEARLKKSNLNSSELAKTIASLKQELEDKTAMLVTFSEELAKKDAQIAELSDNVTNLSKDVRSLAAQTNEQQEVISRQQSEINSVYYRFGTSKELKDAKILVSGKLGADFDTSSFIKKDLTTLKVVPLYAKKGKLISKHPVGSYEFGTDANGKAELRITDAKTFWSLTKYLVVEVNV